MTRIAISVTGALFVAYLYAKVLMAGYPMTIPFLDIVVSI